MKKLQLITVKQYNANQRGLNMSFQNSDGSLRKSGYVVTNGSYAAFYRKLSDAEKAMTEPIDETDYCAMTNEAAMNS